MSRTIRSDQRSTTISKEKLIGQSDRRYYSRQKLVEIIPDKKVVLLVTESKLNWLQKDQHEWTNTRMVFEITTEGDKTVLLFTHEGLVPERECYSRCVPRWNMVIKEWLSNFITDGKAHFLYD